MVPHSWTPGWGQLVSPAHPPPLPFPVLPSVPAPVPMSHASWGGLNGDPPKDVPT